MSASRHHYALRLIVFTLGLYLPGWASAAKDDLTCEEVNQGLAAGRADQMQERFNAGTVRRYCGLPLALYYIEHGERQRGLDLLRQVADSADSADFNYWDVLYNRLVHLGGTPGRQEQEFETLRINRPNLYEKITTAQRKEAWTALQPFLAAPLETPCPQPFSTRGGQDLFVELNITALCAAATAYQTERAKPLYAKQGSELKRRAKEISKLYPVRGSTLGEVQAPPNLAEAAQYAECLDGYLKATEEAMAISPHGHIPQTKTTLDKALAVWQKAQNALCQKIVDSRQATERVQRLSAETKYWTDLRQWYIDWVVEAVTASQPPDATTVNKAIENSKNLANAGYGLSEREDDALALLLKQAQCATPALHKNAANDPCLAYLSAVVQLPADALGSAAFTTRADAIRTKLSSLAKEVIQGMVDQLSDPKADPKPSDLWDKWLQLQGYKVLIPEDQKTLEYVNSWITIKDMPQDQALWTAPQRTTYDTNLKKLPEEIRHARGLTPLPPPVTTAPQTAAAPAPSPQPTTPPMTAATQAVAGSDPAAKPPSYPDGMARGDERDANAGDRSQDIDKLLKTIKARLTGLGKAGAIVPTPKEHEDFRTSITTKFEKEGLSCIPNEWHNKIEMNWGWLAMIEAFCREWNRDYEKAFKAYALAGISLISFRAEIARDLKRLSCKAKEQHDMRLDRGTIEGYWATGSTYSATWEAPCQDPESFDHFPPASDTIVLNDPGQSEKPARHYSVTITSAFKLMPNEADGISNETLPKLKSDLDKAAACIPDDWPLDLKVKWKMALFGACREWDRDFEEARENYIIAGRAFQNDSPMRLALGRRIQAIHCKAHYAGTALEELTVKKAEWFQSNAEPCSPLPPPAATPAAPTDNQVQGSKSTWSIPADAQTKEFLVHARMDFPIFDYAMGHLEGNVNNTVITNDQAKNDIMNWVNALMSSDDDAKKENAWMVVRDQSYEQGATYLLPETIKLVFKDLIERVVLLKRKRCDQAIADFDSTLYGDAQCTSLCKFGLNLKARINVIKKDKAVCDQTEQ